MAKVLIVDDHAVVRAGYRSFLQAESGITELGEAACAEELLAKLTQGKWDLLLLDNHMPERSGLQIIAQIRTQYPELRVLVVSGLPEEQYARHFLSAGASGYISKDSGRLEFLAAVRYVLSRRCYVSQNTVERMVDDLRKPKGPLHELLSRRELEVFRLLALGHRITKIGKELSLNVKTVSTYRARILDKTRFTSNADIIAYATRYKLLFEPLEESAIQRDHISEPSATDT